MGKTTNILDLNNRLTKVEKENVAQNSYNSLKNRPKINGNLLTGDKTGTQLGLQNELTFDSEPTASSNNPVISSGIKTYVDNSVSQFNDEIDALIMTQEYNSTIASIAGNTDDVVNIPVTVPSGYKILGIAAAAAGSRNLAITGTSVGTNSVSAFVYNLFSVALSNVNVYVRVEFKKI